MFGCYIYQLLISSIVLSYSIQGTNTLKLKYIAVISLISLSTNIQAKKVIPPSYYNCQGVNYKIENIKGRQREGSSSKQSDKLREKLRLMKSLKRDCKKKKFSTE